ncbi:MAG: aa3-type cytochrome c oxidase subunit IV [Pikeienuella sp.]
MSEHKHGEMDITVQKKTFEGFIKVGTWGAIVSIVVLIIAGILGL